MSTQVEPLTAVQSAALSLFAESRQLSCCVVSRLMGLGGGDTQNLLTTMASKGLVVPVDGEMWELADPADFEKGRGLLSEVLGDLRPVAASVTAQGDTPEAVRMAGPGDSPAPVLSMRLTLNGRKVVSRPLREEGIDSGPLGGEKGDGSSPGVAGQAPSSAAEAWPSAEAAAFHARLTALEQVGPSFASQMLGVTAGIETRLGRVEFVVGRNGTLGGVQDAVSGLASAVSALEQRAADRADSGAEVRSAVLGMAESLLPDMVKVVRELKSALVETSPVPVGIVDEVQASLAEIRSNVSGGATEAELVGLIDSLGRRVQTYRPL